SADLDHLGLSSFKRVGYVASEEESESVSKTLEYAYDDWCIAQMAKAMGQEELYNRFITRGQHYKNLLNPEHGFFQARVEHQWFEPFRPEEVNFHYTEANAWQYGFYVPQDVKRFADYLGGEAKLAEKLDALFTAPEATSGRHQADITGLIGQYAHGNEPSHHIAYLYNFVGQPDRTQEIVQAICSDLYTTQPDGLSGNEDCGQMSSWFVFSALGFYPVTPGSVDYILGIPLFEEATIQLENGKQFVIKANRKADSEQYVQSVTLNGKPHADTYIKHQDIMNGGELVFVLGDEPSDWGTDPAHYPNSRIEDPNFVATPYIGSGTSTFREHISISLGQLDQAPVYFTLDGSDPKSGNVYHDPILLKQDASLRAIAKGESGNWSPEISRDYRLIDHNYSIQLESKYANQYNGGGDQALIDYVRGGQDFRTGAWQGYQGTDLHAIVDLGEVKQLKSITLSTLQDQRSWIFFPDSVRIETSIDGKSFDDYAAVVNTISEREEGGLLQDFGADKETIGRFIKIHAKNKRTVPDWHLGAGGKAWLFVDELQIEVE
ncbi:MAG: GH92 family glycosyl hydrolase, partial [Bacteroidota bacterium]